jgi:hypothetical protein
MLLRDEFLTPLRYPYINQLTSSVGTYLYGRRMSIEISQMGLDKRTTVLYT